MDDTDRVMAERIHAIVTASAPDLTPRTWYGHAGVRQGRHHRLPFPGPRRSSRRGTRRSASATKVTKADEARIAALVKKAAS
jgi:hypothetical protein